MFGKFNPQSELLRRARKACRSERFRFFCTTSAVLCCLMFGAFAVDETASGGFNLSTVMTTCVTTIINDIMQMITAILPITVTLMGASIGIAYAVRFIKKIVGRAG